MFIHHFLLSLGLSAIFSPLPFPLSSLFLFLSLPPFYPLMPFNIFLISLLSLFRQSFLFLTCNFSIFLVPGARFQLQWIGGPPSNTHVTFGALPSSSSNVATVALNGIVHARSLGTIQVQANATSYSQSNADQLSVGMYVVSVQVGYLDGIRIRARFFFFQISFHLLIFQFQQDVCWY